MKLLFAVLMIGVTFAFSGCGLQLRSPASFPPELKEIYFSSEHPYDNLSIQVRQLLKSMNVAIVNPPQPARFTIAITQDFFTYSLPDMSNASLPSVMNYAQSAMLNIIDNHNHMVIASQQFRTTQTLTLNAGQIYIQNANHVLIQQELNQEMISLIYYWLISLKTTHVLHHAIIVHPT